MRCSSSTVSILRTGRSRSSLKCFTDEAGFSGMYFRLQARSNTHFRHSSSRFTVAPFTFRLGAIAHFCGFANGRDIAVNPVAALPHKTTFHEIAHLCCGENYVAKRCYARCFHTALEVVGHIIKRDSRVGIWGIQYPH
jgi:hypothetical protein